MNARSLQAKYQMVASQREQAVRELNVNVELLKAIRLVGCSNKAYQCFKHSTLAQRKALQADIQRLNVEKHKAHIAYDKQLKIEVKDEQKKHLESAMAKLTKDELLAIRKSFNC